MSVATNDRDITLTCGFYNGEDREYDAEQMSSIFDGVILDGIYESIGERFVVTTSGVNREIVVGTGRAWFNHTWTLNDDPMILECGVADPLSPRIDAVVIEVNKDESIRDNFIKVIEGTPATNPVKPTLSKGPNVYQHPLCYIYRPADVDIVKQANITNCVGTETPFVTGILETRSIDDLLLSWQADLDDFVADQKAQCESEIANFIVVQEGDFLRWKAGYQDSLEQVARDAEQWTQNQEAYFISWFNEMKGLLSTDAAGKLQMQLDNNEIKRLLVCGLDSGTKTISEDGRTITTTDNNGLTHTKSYNDDFSICVTLLTSSEGGAIGRLTKRFSSDGSTISSTMTIY